MKLAVLVLFLLFCFTVAEEMTVLTEEVPPLSYADEEGYAAGFSVEIVTEIMKRAGVRATDGRIKVYPWARAYMLLEQEKNLMLFSTTRTAEREDLFYWVGPIAPREIWFYKLKSRKDIVADSLADLKAFTVGSVRGFASTKHLEKHGFSLDYCNTEMQNFKKLQLGRVDVITANTLNAAYIMKLQGGSFHELEAVLLLEGKYRYYIAINKKTSPDLVSRLQNALDEMKSDSTYDRIFEKYLQ